MCPPLLKGHSMPHQLSSVSQTPEFVSELTTITLSLVRILADRIRYMLPSDKLLLTANEWRQGELGKLQSRGEEQ